MTKLRPLSAETLTVGAALLTTAGVAFEIISPIRGFLFIIGMVAGATFHIISNRTLDDEDVSTEDQAERGETRGSVSVTDFGREFDADDSIAYDSPEADSTDHRRTDKNDADESASTKAVFGSNGGSRNRRNSGSKSGRR